MYKLYDVQNDKEDIFDSGQAMQALQSGRYTVEQGKTYNMTDPSGRLVGVDGSQLFDAIENGYNLADQKTIDFHKEQQENDAKNIQTGLESAARSVTFGGSDWLLINGLGKALGMEDFTREELEKRRLANPDVDLFSGLAGDIVTSLFGAGAGYGVKAASAAKKGAGVTRGLKKISSLTPSYQVSKYAAKGEKFLLNKLGKRVPVDSIIGRSALGAGIVGASGAVEGLVREGSRYFAEQQIGDADFSASNLGNYLQNGAIWGGIFGSVGGFLTEGIGSAAEKIARKYPDVGLKGLEVASGVTPESQRKFLMNPDGLTNIRSEEELVSELTSRYQRVADQVEETGENVAELEKIIKDQEIALGQKIKEKKDIFKEAQKELKSSLEKWRKENLRNPVPEELVAKIDGYIDGLNGRISQSSKRAYDILIESDVEEAITRAEIKAIYNNAIERYKGVSGFPTSESSKKAIKKLEASRDYLLSNVGESINPATAKHIIQGLDEDSKKFYTRNTLEFDDVIGSGYKEVRRGFDQLLKERVVGYKEAMEPVSEMMGIRDRVLKYGANRDAVNMKLKNLHNGLNQDYVKDLKSLANAYGENIGRDLEVAATKQLLAKQARIEGYVPVIKRYNPETGRVYVDSSAVRRMDTAAQSAEQLKYRQFPNETKRLLELSKDIETLNYAGQKYGPLTSENARRYLEKKLKWVADHEISASKRKLSGKSRILAEAKKDLKKISPFKTVDSTRDIIKTELSRAESRAVKEVFSFIGSLSKPDEIKDFVSWIELLRLKHVFNRKFTRGSRNVNLWSGIFYGATALVGTGIGGPMAGMVSAIFSRGLGYAIGAIIDTYGPKITLKLLRRLSEIDGNITASKITKEAVDALPYNEASKKFLYEANKAKEIVDKFNKRMVGKIKKTADSYIKRPIKSGIPLNRTEKEFDKKTYRELREDVEKIEASKVLYMDGVEDINDVIFPVLPNIMENFRQKNIRAAEFIVSKFPKQPLTDIYDEWEPSVYELEKFKKYIEYTYTPSKFFDDMENGYISPEGVETLKKIHPALFDRISESIYEEVMDKEAYKKLSPTKRFQLAKHFYVNPLDIYRHDKTMMYQNMKSPLADQEQQQIAQTKAESGQNAGQGTDNLKQTGLNSLEMDKRSQTRMNNISNRV